MMVEKVDDLVPAEAAEAADDKAAYPAAPPASRIFAFLIDAVIAAGPMTVAGTFVLMPFIWMMTVTPMPALYEDEAFMYTMIAILMVGILWFIFYSLCRDGFGGRSLGKRLFGLMVVTIEEGKPCPMGKSMLRNLLMVLIALFHFLLPLIGFLGLLVEPIAIITSPLGQRFGDRWAETLVIKVER